MEFNEKLQELRKQKGLTQEELASKLYVSRTAISKWESGRGYPNIESLKVIAQFFSVTVDDLLSSNEVLTLAEENQKITTLHFRDLVFGLLDICASLFLFLPLFATKAEGVITEATLLTMDGVGSYLKTAYFTVVVGMVLVGVLTLALQNCQGVFWMKSKTVISLTFGILTLLLFILSLQPYAAVFAFALLIIKAIMLAKRP
ncbi:MAG: helix-turn-helix transcriptional regulator [Ruminococcaceae bacterium]|nr:helix-turn-helix transcriptional regulator [Oscillospiraceae bacterium]